MECLCLWLKGYKAKPHNYTAAHEHCSIATVLGRKTRGFKLVCFRLYMALLCSARCNPVGE